MAYERINKDKVFDGAVRESHEWRYKWASNFILPEDRVIDVACGSCYGRELLGGGSYTGIDKEWQGDEPLEYFKAKKGFSFIPADLEKFMPNFYFDVFVCLETIEHIKNYQNLLDMARKAKQYAIISTPILPNNNPYHVHQFTEDQLRNFLPKLVSFEKQDSGDGNVKGLYGIACFDTA